jgi:hypothetical protein
VFERGDGAPFFDADLSLKGQFFTLFSEDSGSECRKKEEAGLLRPPNENYAL